MVEIVMDVNYIELHVEYMLKLVNNMLELVRINLVLKYCVVVELRKLCSAAAPRRLERL